MNPMRYLRYALNFIGRVVSNSVSNVILRISDAELSTPVAAYGIPYIVNNGKLVIGSQVVLSSGFRGNPVGGADRVIIVVQKGAELVIGDGVGISNAEIYCSRKITIGNNSLIGGGVKIYDTDFHSVHSNDRKNRVDPGIRSGPISIGEDTFIGGFSIILKNVNIGRGSVIGAGSLVTKNVPAGEIWAGNPAAFVRRIPNTSARKKPSGQDPLL